MNIEEIRNYCLRKKGTEESFPFDEVTLVIKIGGKMFILIALDRDPAVNLKCDPEKAIELRESYPAIVPGYHMSKKHWNTLQLDGSLPDRLIIELIDHSYNLVYQSLPLKIRTEIDHLI